VDAEFASKNLMWVIIVQQVSDIIHVSNERREGKNYVFKVFYFVFEFLVFCLILGVFCASSNANSEGFVIMPTGYRSLILPLTAATI
jgi:hypothetical protein